MEWLLSEQFIRGFSGVVAIGGILYYVYLMMCIQDVCKVSSKNLSNDEDVQEVSNGSGKGEECEVVGIDVQLKRKKIILKMVCTGILCVTMAGGLMFGVPGYFVGVFYSMALLITSYGITKYVSDES